MGIKLHVRVQEARNLAAKDSNGLSDPYVRLQLGSSKAKSKIIYKNLNPVWNEVSINITHPNDTWFVFLHMKLVWQDGENVLETEEEHQPADHNRDGE